MRARVCTRVSRGTASVCKRESGPGERVCTRVHVCEAGDGRLEAAVWPQVQPVRRPRL